jgi:hypothetical protein
VRLAVAWGAGVAVRGPTWRRTVFRRAAGAVVGGAVGRGAVTVGDVGRAGAAGRGRVLCTVGARRRGVVGGTTVGGAGVGGVVTGGVGRGRRIGDSERGARGGWWMPTNTRRVRARRRAVVRRPGWEVRGADVVVVEDRRGAAVVVDADVVDELERCTPAAFGERGVVVVVAA